MSKNALTTFNFNTSAVRVVEIEGNPWFVASDVCAALAFTRPDNLLRHLELSEKQTVTPHLVRAYGIHHRSVVIAESGVFKLIMRSDKPEAKAFQNWVTQIVLPAIRKDGGYIAGEEKVASGEMSEDELVFKAMGVMQRKIERLSGLHPTRQHHGREPHQAIPRPA